MKRRHILTLIGFLLFLLGAVGLIVNLIGLTFVLTDWMDRLTGKSIGFAFKLILMVGGLVLAIVTNSKEDDGYDEYFDGEKYY